MSEIPGQSGRALPAYQSVEKGHNRKSYGRVVVSRSSDDVAQQLSKAGVRPAFVLNKALGKR